MDTKTHVKITKSLLEQKTSNSNNKSIRKLNNKLSTSNCTPKLNLIKKANNKLNVANNNSNLIESNNIKSTKNSKTPKEYNNNFETPKKQNSLSPVVNKRSKRKSRKKKPKNASLTKPQLGMLF